jgi:hypothetical protein
MFERFARTFQPAAAVSYNVWRRRQRRFLPHARMFSGSSQRNKSKNVEILPSAKLPDIFRWRD